MKLTKQKMIFAFRPGRAGDQYTAEGVQFKIVAVANVDFDKGNKIYWIAIVTGSEMASRDFVYTERAGVVGINMVLPRQSAAKHLYLISGSGLLSENGFPHVRKNKN